MTLGHDDDRPVTIQPESVRSVPSGPRRLRRFLRRFRKDRKGVTAVEFALVAAPFFALLFAIMETALAFWSAQVLENAVADASRRIYTGEFQTANSGLPADQLATIFRQEVCARVTGLFNCETSIRIDVRTFQSFPGDVPLPVQNGALDTSDFAFRSSGPNDIVVVRVAMEYPIYVSLLNPNPGNLSNGKRLIMASSAFRNEPFNQ